MSLIYSTIVLYDVTGSGKTSLIVHVSRFNLIRFQLPAKADHSSLADFDCEIRQFIQVALCLCRFNFSFKSVSPLELA